MIDPVSTAVDNGALVPSDPSRWRIPDGQHFVFADFDDGILMFDARTGSTHLLNPTAAEALSIIQQSDGLAPAQIYRALLDRLSLDQAALPFDAVIDLLWQLENLGLVATVV